MRAIIQSISLSMLAALPPGEAVAAPATALKVCVQKSSGATVARATCKSSELTFSEASYSAGRDTILYVAKKGAKYKSINAALASIPSSLPTATSPIVVKVGPGTFTLTEALLIPSYVTLEGAGPEATTINTPTNGGILLRSNSALKKVNINSRITQEGLIVAGIEVNSSNVAVEDVSIMLSSALSIQIGIGMDGGGCILRRVKITSPALSVGGTGISSNGSSNTIDDAEITLYGDATGISINNSPNINLHNIRTTIQAVQGGQDPTGINVGGATTKFYGNGLKVKVDCSIGNICNALYVSGPVDDVVVMNSSLESVGATAGTAAAGNGGTAQILHSKLSASGTNPPVGALAASTVKVAATQLSGGSAFIDGGSTITCAGVIDENYAFSASSCP